MMSDKAKIEGTAFDSDDINRMLEALDDSQNYKNILYENPTYTVEIFDIFLAITVFSVEVGD